MSYKHNSVVLKKERCFLVLFVFSIVSSVMISCSEKTDNYEKDHEEINYVRDYAVYNTEHYLVDHVNQGNVVRSELDRRKVQFLKNYFRKIEENNIQKTDFHIDEEKFNELNSLFTQSGFFKDPPYRLYEHYQLYIYLINDLFKNQLEIAKYNIASEASILVGKHDSVYSVHSKDSVLIAIKLYDDYKDYKNTFFINNKEFNQRGWEFYIPIPTSEKGEGEINGFVRVFTRQGKYDTLHYNIPYKIE